MPVGLSIGWFERSQLISQLKVGSIGGVKMIFVDSWPALVVLSYMMVDEVLVRLNLPIHILILNLGSYGRTWDLVIFGHFVEGNVKYWLSVHNLKVHGTYLIELLVFLWEDGRTIDINVSRIISERMWELITFVGTKYLTTQVIFVQFQHVVGAVTHELVYPTSWSRVEITADKSHDFLFHEQLIMPFYLGNCIS